MHAATPAGTARLRDRGLTEGRHPDAYRVLGRTSLVVSAVGFGGLRSSEEVPEHREALEASLDAGVNLIDTAPTYLAGASERLIGEVLRGRPRDELVVMTKIGYVQGDSRERVTQRAGSGKPYKGLIRISDEIDYSLDPEVLDDELQASLLRMGLGRVDVVLLHDPEAWLAYRGGPVAERYAAFRTVIQRAFEWLESQARIGRIGWYGVCSEALVPTREENTAGIAFEDLLTAARKAGGPEHRFGVVELPVNVIELSATLPVGASVVDMAHAAGVAVVATRPLNAFLPQGLLRLVDFAAAEAAPRIERSRRASERLEVEFDDGIGTALASGGVVRVPEFRFASALEHRATEVGEPVQFGEYVQGRLTTELGERVQAFEPRLSAPLRVAFRFWLERYVDSLTTLSAALHARCIERATARVRRVRHGIEAVLGRPGRLSSSQIALRGVMGLPGVTSVLVGMRRPEYVVDVTATLAWPAAEVTADRLAAWRNGEDLW